MFAFSEPRNLIYSVLYCVVSFKLLYKSSNCDLYLCSTLLQFNTLYSYDIPSPDDSQKIMSLHDLSTEV